MTIIALALFFMTLLALTVYIGFGYLVSAALLTAMITWYAHGTVWRRRLTALVASMLEALYAAMYLLLRLEAYSLLVRTIVLLLTPTVLMRSTRRIAPGTEGESAG